jgi:transcriptional regulator with XRE-family HTH domain
MRFAPVMDARELVAWNLLRLRAARGVAQETLAIDAEIDHTYLNRLGCNLENPTVAVLERLAQALEVDIVEFFAKPKPGAKTPPVLRKGRKPRK